MEKQTFIRALFMIILNLKSQIVKHTQQQKLWLRKLQRRELKKKHAERKSEAKETADKRQEAIVEKRDLEKEQLKEIWEEKQTSIQTYSNSGDDMVKEVEPSGSQFNFTA